MGHYGTAPWFQGYNAALKADRPADFEAWFAKSTEGTPFEAWIAGWHSVWKCERRDENPALAMGGKS
jgi:hypothetical protein